jgi:hypothetical protein
LDCLKRGEGEEEEEEEVESISNKTNKGNGKGVWRKGMGKKLR